MPMEEQCEFIWQIIEGSPLLQKKMHELEQASSNNYDEQVSGFIDFFREIEKIIDCVVDSYHQTRILNNYSHIIRLRS